MRRSWASCFAAAIVVGTAATANAVSVQTFDTYDTLTQAAGTLLATKLQIYMSLLHGRNAEAFCINDNFIPRDERNGADDVADNLLGPVIDGNADKRSLESILWKTINERCGASRQQGAGYPMTKFTPIHQFFHDVPERLSEARAISMALGTQAIRVNAIGKDSYANCILAKLITPKDDNTPAEGFTDLSNQLESHKSSDVPIEQILAASLLKNCGQE